MENCIPENNSHVSPIAASWLEPPPRPILPDDEIHIWRAALDPEPAVLSRLAATLAPDEKARAARFHFPRDRDSYAAARGILRELLGMYLDRRPADLQFDYTPREKPFLRPGASGPRLSFNLSHSHGLALFAFSRGREIGMDVEQILPEFTGDEIAARYFSARELAELRALPAELRAEGFFLCWTRKEAYVKACGGGLQIPLASFSVSLTPGKPEALDSTDSSRWKLRSLYPGPGYAGAVVAEGREWRLRQWDWKP